MSESLEKPITIAATSDIHGLLEGLEEVCNTRNVNVLVIAGDIEPADIFVSKPYFFEREFFPLIRRLQCEVVVTPGNHDFYLAAHYTRITSGEWSVIPPNFHLLIDDEVIIGGLRFYGTPWVPFISGQWCFEERDKNLGEIFEKIPHELDVLITHSPPLVNHRKIDISCDRPKEWQRHYGSLALTNAIYCKFPRLVFCGHIHSGDHNRIDFFREDRNHKVSCWNVSRVNEHYNIEYKIRIVEICGNGEIVELPYNEGYPKALETQNRG